jgi:hypothetical protein
LYLPGAPNDFVKPFDIDDLLERIESRFCQYMYRKGFYLGFKNHRLVHSAVEKVFTDLCRKHINNNDQHHPAIIS